MKVKMVCIDVDGTLSATTYYSARGEEMKAFNLKDGMGIELLQKRGIIPVIITREKSDIVLARARKLGIKDVYVGVDDKKHVVEMVRDHYCLENSQIAYIGDDVNDLEAMDVAGISFCPSDAVEEVLAKANVVLKRKGGEGAVREAIDHIFKKHKEVGK